MLTSNMRVREAENAVAYPVKYLCGFAPLFASLHQLFPHTSLSSVFTQHSFPSVPACEEAGEVLWGEHQCSQTHSPAMHSAWLQQHSFNHPLLLFISSVLWEAPTRLSVLGALIWNSTAWTELYRANT